MATVPDAVITGTVIESSWGNDVRAGFAENPAYLAEAAGDLFVASGAGAIERLAIGPTGTALMVGGAGLAYGSPRAMGLLSILANDPAYPFNGGSSTDVVISTDTEWDDGDYPDRIVQARKLTIAAGQTLTLRGGPWYLFLDEIEFGDTDSHISGDGPDGSAIQADNDLDIAGGYRSATAIGSGGCGGVTIIIVANSITGADGVISANGGDGFTNGASPASSGSSNGNGAARSGGRLGYYNTSGANQNTSADDLHGNTQSLASTAAGGYGNGIGNGGGAHGSGSPGGGQTKDWITPNDVILSALYGVRGGGGGGVGMDNSPIGVGAGGGGGGAVLVFVVDLSATPTIEANGGGGVGSGSGSGADGGAGYVEIVEV